VERRVHGGVGGFWKEGAPGRLADGLVLGAGKKKERKDMVTDRWGQTTRRESCGND
jgi:hypothetical protein